MAFLIFIPVGLIISPGYTCNIFNELVFFHGVPVNAPAGAPVLELQLLRGSSEVG